MLRPLLCLAGLVVCRLIHHVKASQKFELCGAVGLAHIDCQPALSSPWAMVLGQPLERYGMLLFLGILLLSVMNRSSRAQSMLIALALFFSSGLLAVQVYAVQKLCSLCLLSFIIICVLFFSQANRVEASAGKALMLIGLVILLSFLHAPSNANLLEREGAPDYLLIQPQEKPHFVRVGSAMASREVYMFVDYGCAYSLQALRELLILARSYPTDVALYIGFVNVTNKPSALMFAALVEDERPSAGELLCYLSGSNPLRTVSHSTMRNVARKSELLTDLYKIHSVPAVYYKSRRVNFSNLSHQIELQYPATDDTH
jgi:uncharacterized membrane protein